MPSAPPRRPAGSSRRSTKRRNTDKLLTTASAPAGCADQLGSLRACQAAPFGACWHKIPSGFLSRKSSTARGGAPRHTEFGHHPEVGPMTTSSLYKTRKVCATSRRYSVLHARTWASLVSPTPYDSTCGASYSSGRQYPSSGHGTPSPGSSQPIRPQSSLTTLPRGS